MVCWLLFVIIVLGKLFLNNLLDRMDKKNYIMFLAVIFAMVSLYYSRYILVNFVTGLEVIFTGIFLYSLGGFIRRYNPFEKIRAWALVAVIILINLLVCGNYYIEAAKNIQAYNAGETGAFLQTIPLYANHQFVPIILAAAVFELFRRINIPESKIINYLGASTFMVYLLMIMNLSIQYGKCMTGLHHCMTIWECFLRISLYGQWGHSVLEY